jgi:hypothetical protein
MQSLCPGILAFAFMVRNSMPITPAHNRPVPCMFAGTDPQISASSCTFTYIVGEEYC